VPKIDLTKLVNAGVDPDEIADMIDESDEDAREPLREAEIAKTRAAIDRNRRRLNRARREQKGAQSE
jgi:predicted nucleotidyltransferase